MSQTRFTRIGIVGFGQLGQYLVDQILTNGHELGLQLAFVWNRTKTDELNSIVDKTLILDDLKDFVKYEVDIIVEVSHPIITRQFGAEFLKHSDFMIGSPSALADKDLEKSLISASEKFGVFIPSGALWGGSDIREMSDRNALKELRITMTFHPNSLKLDGDLKTLNDSITDKPIVLYKGPVRQVCSLAPNNVNTMAAAALAGYSLGFDGTIGCLISDPNSKDYHKIEIELIGPKGSNDCSLKVNTTRLSPSSGSHVSSSATFGSFLSSLLNAQHKGKGFHLC